jgi:hypothetical protein
MRAPPHDTATEHPMEHGYNFLYKNLRLGFYTSKQFENERKGKYSKAYCL